jgi:hypothetical protein
LLRPLFLFFLFLFPYFAALERIKLDALLNNLIVAFSSFGDFSSTSLFTLLFDIAACMLQSDPVVKRRKKTKKSHWIGVWFGARYYILIASS